MAGIIAASGLPAGAAGVAALLLLAFALDAPLWAAIPAAAAAYAGVAVLHGERRPSHTVSTDDRRAPLTAALLHVATLHRLAARIDRPEVRQQVTRIAASAERVVRAVQEDGNETAAQLFVDQVLDPVVALLADYVRLSTRCVASAAAAIERTETRDFPLIEQAIDDIYERLHRSHLVDLATTGELLEWNLERVANVIGRRARS